MATVTSSGQTLLLAAGEQLHRFSRHEATLKETHTLDILEISKQIPLSKNSDGSEKKEQLQFYNNFQILVSSFSNGGDIAAVATSAKTVVLISTKDGLSVLRSFRISKPPTAMVFDAKDEYVVVADRAGVVRRYSVDASSAIQENTPHIDNDDADETDFEGVFVASAISMILQLSFSPCGRYLLASDRDEKLRVYRYPQTYVLHAVCLGHKDYVSSIAVLPTSPTVALTAGGEGDVLAWNSTDGRQLATLTLFKDKPIRKICVFRTAASTWEVLGVENASSRVVTFSVSSEGERLTMEEVKRADVGESARIHDVVCHDGNIVVLSTSGLGLLDTSSLSVSWVEVGEELAATLASLVDPIQDLSKKTAFDNMTDYLQRKAAKMDGRKKKGGRVSSITEPPSKKESLQPLDEVEAEV